MKRNIAQFNRKIISIPPNYFYAAIIMVVLFQFIFPSFNLIAFPWNLLGLLLIIVGVYLVIYCSKHFERRKTPEKFQTSTCLVTDGFYKYSRNPMYVGGMIFLIGLVIALQNVLAFISPILFFLVMQLMFIPYEEEKMEHEIGDEYIQYKKKVRRWL